MRPVRVLVVDDSLTLRREICAALESDPRLRVVGEARDGRQAVELCRELRPDVITMDMALPRLDGLGATEEIMKDLPTPILVVSGSTNRGEVLRTCDALAAGAVDAFEKPGPGADLEAWREELRMRVRVVARVRVIRHLLRRARPGAPAPRPSPPPGKVAVPPPTQVDLVALGASTGGPSALAAILGPLPATYRLPVLVVLHLDGGFSDGFRDWLAARVALPVAFARDRQPLPRAGTPGVLLAPPDHHLVLEGRALRLDAGPERHSCRPSVDALFESLAKPGAPRTMAALLTGMGRDGAVGLLELAQAGALTVAQDEESSAVYGMPGEAARLGAASVVLPIHAIGELLLELGRPLAVKEGA